MNAGGIAAAYGAGLIKGRTDDAFAPNDAISREEMAAMLVRAYAYAGGKDLAAGEAAPLADAGAVSRRAVADVDKAVASGLMTGVGGGCFAPEAQATRAETAEALLRLLRLLRPAA
ncbi:S-layer homology domain-containing protein [Paenibacillus sp. UNC496MF]|uniref:S-layer homology domain-containing protein n=1 Tax=Paenibacillus sp. UNC496MF TaxID=1502753 RepID=UPI0008F148C7|nr:S-layer homology domain-containing protein [Paenibacillus sp. UNC496MF]SFJ80466.1 S-layer homology domain-containing protein [Paenibacillus sp. UNC496MF]